MIKWKQALTDPTSVFKTPAELLLNNELTREQKIHILKRWESDIREIQVAEDENMQGKERVDLKDVLDALNTLDAVINLEDTPPTKQGG